MAASVLQAMIARFQGSRSRSLVNFDLFFSEIPAGDTMPTSGTWAFAVIAHGGATEPDYQAEADYFEFEAFSFFVHGNNLPYVENVALEIKKTFDLPGTTEANNALPTVNTYIQECVRKSYTLGQDPTTSQVADKVYVAQLDYTVKSYKTKGLS